MRKGICSVAMGSGARQLRDGGEQFAGVVVLWLMEHLFGDANCDSMVLSLPDSPTSPSDSPSPMRSDTSFTGRTHPAAVGNSTVNPRTSDRGIITLMIRMKQ